MSQFIGTTMPMGYEGSLSRAYFDNTIEAKVNDGVKGFGVPVKLDTTTGKVQPCTSTGDTVFGFSLREYLQAPVKGSDGALTVGVLSVLRRGYFLAKVAGTPAIGGKVYLDASGALTADSASTTEIPNAVFAGKATDGLVEIAYNI